MRIIPLVFNKQQFSLAVYDNFSFAGAFQLELGSEPLDVPVQLAIPAPQNVAAGTEVFFMRKVSLPDLTGTMKTMWLVEESGIVGNDGMIRTSSPPWQGVCQSGEYILTVPKFSYNVAKAIIRPDLVDAANVAGIAIINGGFDWL